MLLAGASPAAERLREASRRSRAPMSLSLSLSTDVGYPPSRYEAELASSPQPSASRVRSGTPERTPLHSASRARFRSLFPYAHAVPCLVLTWAYRGIRDGTPDRSTPAKAAKEGTKLAASYRAAVSLCDVRSQQNAC
eukprot:3607385-Rhodomonas_salina.1